jgi:5,10-methylenetetrahydromethanopterin reductase
VLQMLHPAGYGSARPIAVPFLIAAAGPKGIAAAHEPADGVFAVRVPIAGFRTSVVLTFGTVLEDGEDPGSARALAAAGHAATVRFHSALDRGQLGTIAEAETWAKAYATVPARVRHLALHDQHLIAINERDRPFVNGALLAKQGLALSRAGWGERVAFARVARCHRDRVSTRRTRYRARTRDVCDGSSQLTRSYALR